MTVHRNRFLVNKTNRCTEYKFYWYYYSTCFGQPFCPSSGVLSLNRLWYILCSCDELFATRNRMELVFLYRCVSFTSLATMNFMTVWPCIVTDSLGIKPTDALNSNFFGITTLHVLGSLSAHHQEFLAVHRLWYTHFYTVYQIVSRITEHPNDVKERL